MLMAIVNALDDALSELITCLCFKSVLSLAFHDADVTAVA